MWSLTRESTLRGQIGEAVVSKGVEVVGHWEFLTNEPRETCDHRFVGIPPTLIGFTVATAYRCRRCGIGVSEGEYFWYVRGRTHGRKWGEPVG